ncbi:MAG TPA: OmpH family outer membrane protein [Phycisphaerae bacterium]|jgi:Skp family chaperone for outer membrane proteins|nr:OmpH family outer membrane protein [Phycisphaerae bacterium]HOB75968.1 OmpH family outer membrane protein [Phycisphaerae bacterium]HOJ55841.1 OmpH family outer membrane protein [Phycisphaerae bacterium]HOL27814.1 OmpH family outer membrane protein [Phycisphaerae bacterium]HPP22257.1 OmpH family outer membrane protein [Phycisphaerae bacterium]
MSHGKNWMAAGLVGLVAVAAGVTWNNVASGADRAANAEGATRVAVVDLVRVFNEFDQTKVLNQKMSALEDELRSEDQRKTAEIESQKNALKAFAPDSVEYKKQSEILKRLMIEYQVWKSMKQDHVADSHLRWVNRTYKRVEDEVAAIARARNFQLVITKEELDTSITDSKVMLKQIVGRKVLFSDASVDLTDEVLTRLNAAFQKAGGARSIDFNK